MWGSQLHFAQVVIVSWHQLAGPPSDFDPNRSWLDLFKIPNFHFSHPSTFQPSKLPTFPQQPQQSTIMDANNQNGDVEGTPSKKHTIGQSPRKPSPAKVSSLSRHVLLFTSAWRHNTSPVPSASPPPPFFMLQCFTSTPCKTSHQQPASLLFISRTSTTYSLTNTVLTSATHVCPSRLAHFALVTFCCQHSLCFFFHLEHSGLHPSIHLALSI